MKLTLVILGAILLLRPAPAAPVITEFLASNRESLDDEDGDSSDWIEIFNPEAETLDLGGHTLGTSRAQWTFPDNTILAPGTALVVFASGKDRPLALRPHTSFTLPAEGDSLFLRDPEGLMLSSFPEYPRQRRDISYGITATGEAAFFPTPTPGETNGDSRQGFVADTVFSKKRGFQQAPFNLEITTATPDATIRYTIDGTEPSPTNGVTYTGPFLVASSVVVRAMSYKDGWFPTNVDAQTYLFTEDLISQAEMNEEVARSPLYQDELPLALRDLPVVSLSFDNADLLGPEGIYRNPSDKGRSSERPIHFEFFDPNHPEDSVHQSAGVRIHGGNSRSHPKKPLRLYFREDYGKERLDHPLFPNSPVESFFTLLLRAGGHDAWIFQDNWDQATLLRNPFLHRLQREMGQTSPHSRHVNVFLNSTYWGIYELQEFPHEHYNADHHGGDPEDWDVVKHGQEVEAGNSSAWDSLIRLARAGIRSSQDYDAIQEFLDLDNFIDAMIHRIWASDEDWLSPFFFDGEDMSVFDDDKNWYVARKSRNGSSKFFFYSWDAEMSMGIPFVGERTFENDFTRIDTDNSPAIIYDSLRRYPEFRLRFADRLQRHFLNGGPFTSTPLLTSWNELRSGLETAIVAESARWGSQVWFAPDRATPFTRDDQWRPAVNWVSDQFLTNRTAVVLSQFEQVGLTSPIPAPEINAPPGTPGEPINVTLTADSTIYFTRDGSDPRRAGVTSSTRFLGPEADLLYLVPTQEIGTTWRGVNPPANLAQWNTGQNGIGYDTGADRNYLPLIKTTVGEMQGQNASIYLRYEFDITAESLLRTLNSLNLFMRIDDGFAAYLNGSLVAFQNFGGDSWNAPASSSNPDAEALRLKFFNLEEHIGLLQIGRNVLAIHGQNANPNNNDFFAQAILEATSTSTPTLSPSAERYTGPISLEDSSLISARSRDDSGQWSALNERYFSIATTPTPGALVVSEIHYHPAEPTSADERSVSTNQDDYEFLELFNQSNRTLDLSGASFDRGIGFTFPQGSTLRAGARAVLVSHREAFLARYGADLAPHILGQFERDSNLSNSGETLSLRRDDGTLLFNLRYDDQFPWPSGPDGSGTSLTLRTSLTKVMELNSAASWTTSNATHGTPAEVEELSYLEWLIQLYNDPALPAARPSAPAFGSSLNNLLAYATGADLAPPLGESAPPLTLNGQTYAAFRYRGRKAPRGVTLAVEFSPNLIDWTTMTLHDTAPSLSDGTQLFVARSAQPVHDSHPGFFRFRARLAGD